MFFNLKDFSPLECKHAKTSNLPICMLKSRMRAQIISKLHIITADMLESSTLPRIEWTDSVSMQYKYSLYTKQDITLMHSIKSRMYT